MTNPSPAAMRHGLGRALRSAAALLAGLLVTTCADNPTAPNRPGFGAMRVRPAFDQYALFAPLVLNQVRAIVVRPPADTLIDTVRAFNPSDQQLTLSLRLTLQSTRETMDVTLQLLAGQTLLFSGTEAVEVRQGSNPSSTSIPVTYEGPGANATELLLEPRDTVVQVGSSTPMRATALDGEGEDVGQFYLNWSLVGSAPGASIDATGLLRAPTTAGTVIVRGITPSGLRDSVSVVVVPAPSTLARSSGDNQTAAPGERLVAPLAVLVTGGGGVPVPGVAVSFAATTGGGTVDSATATSDASGIARSGVILGPTVGAQTFTAGSAGLSPVVFTATAVGITIQAKPHTIASGLEHSCELRSGTAFCWGGNGGDQIGDNTGGFNALVAMPVQGGLSFTSLTAGNTHTCGLTAAGAAFCWGDNSDAQLGDGTLTNRTVPTPVTGGQVFVQLEAGEYHTCGLTAGGQAFCWGFNGSGAIGDGSTTPRQAPVAVSGGLTFARITGGDDFTCALTVAGAAFCWGDNSDGQIGDGSITNRLVPAAVGGGRTFTDIGAGFRTSCGLDGAGAGFCWGQFFGATLTTPTAVGGGVFASFSTGGDHVCGLTSAGAALCGGDNSNGQLGNNSTSDSPTPVAVSGGLVFTELAAGGLHTCGRTVSGSHCWGRGNAGQTGDGSGSQRLTPVLVRGPVTSIAINAGNGQNTTPGSPVAIPPSVIVRDAQNAGLPGVQVVFTIATGGGSLTLPTAFTNASGIATVGSWTLGATPGPNSLVATATVPGLAGNPVNFTASGGTLSAVRIWTGAASTAFNNGANWSGGQVPGTSDSVRIVAATNEPQLTVNTTVGTLEIAGGSLTVGDHLLTVAGDFSTSGSGVLIMNNSGDAVTVGGNADFDGGDESEFLTDGVLTITGNLSQTAGTSASSFFPSGDHVTVFTAGSHSVSFASPGASNGSGFQSLTYPGGGNLTLSTAVFVRGTATLGGSATTVTSANGSRLTVNLLGALSPLTFNNVPLTIDQTLQTSIANQALTFQNMATDVSQLVINHPGTSSPLTLTGLVFSTVPVAPNGFYLDVTDNLADANPVVINMVGATPAAGAPFIRTTGGATVTWAVSGVLRTWTGAVSSDWETAGNWSGGQPPQAGDDVLIPEGPANFPVYAGLLSIRNLIIESESGETTLTLNGAGGLSVTGDLLNNGQILGSARIAIVGPGPHRVHGSFANLAVEGPTTVENELVVTGSLELTGATTVLQMANATVDVGLDFSLGSGASFATNLNTNLTIGRDASFAGGSTAGLIQGGQILVGGNLTAGASDGAFAPGNANSVTLNGTGPQIITLGSSASYFDNLAISNSTGPIVLATDVTVFGTFGGGGSGVVVQGPGALTAGQLNIGNLVFDGARLVLNALSADVSASLNGVTFQNYSGAQPQLEINHPGVPSNVLEIDGLVFTGTPASFHLLVNDNAADGVPLVINLTNPTPADGTGLFSVQNGATVNWPATQPVWTGVVGSDWQTPGNWSVNRVPGPLDRVTISPAGNQPVLSADAAVLSLTVSGTGTRVTPNGRSLTVAGNLVIGAGALLVMTDPSDRVIVNGDAAFAGIDPSGFMTAGELRLAGGFSQGSNNQSFRPSGSHRTVMVGATLQSVGFCCGAGTSWFQNLDISQSVGINYQFSGNGVLVFDTLISRPSGPTPRLYALGSPFTARRVNVTRMTVDRGTFTLNENGVAANHQFDNVTFENYLATQTQMAIVVPGGGRTFTFNNLHFQPLVTGNTGRYLNVSSSAGTLVVDLPGATPASNGPAFTVEGGGVTVNWPVNDNAVWTGTTSTNWDVGTNWASGNVPVAANDVIIPAGTPNAPHLTRAGDSFIRGIAVASGAVLFLDGPGRLLMEGNLAADGAIAGVGGLELFPSGGPVTARGNVQGLTVFGQVTMSGILAVANDLILAGNATRLTVAGHAIVTGRDFTVQDAAILQMVNAADQLSVGRNALFSGGTDITTGVIVVVGSFAQNGSTLAFRPGGDNLVVLGGSAAQFVSFANPTASGFTNLTVTNATGTITLQSDVIVDSVFAAAAVNSVIQGQGPRKLTVGGANIAALTLVGLPLTLATANAARPVALNGITFNGFLTTDTQLTIDHPGLGAGGSLTLSNLTFETVPTSGFYLRVNDNTADGNPLVVNLTSPTPATGGSFIQTAGGATVNWPTVPSEATWTGAVSTAWATPGNWSGSAVPGSITDVTIPAGTPFAPTAGAVSGTSAHNLLVQAGATLTLTNPFGVAVTGNVDVAGAIAGGTLQMTGATATLRGTVPTLNITGAVTLNGITTTGSSNVTVTGAAAELILGGNTFLTTGLLFSNGARLAMTNAADSLVVNTTAQFSGGSTIGRLTAGVLDLKGSFTQTNSGGSDASFASTGTRVRSTGASTATFGMATGLPGQSRFSALLVNKTGGVINLSGSLVMINDSLVVNSATTVNMTGSLNPRLVRLAAGAGLGGSGSIQVNGDSLFVATPVNYTIGNTLLDGTPGANQEVPALPYPSLTLQGAQTHSLVARTATTGPVFVIDGNLVLSGQTLATGAGLQIQDNGQLVMNNTADSLLVGGNAFFISPLDGTGNLTAGVLRVSQNMTVDGSPTGFAPSGTHKTILASVATSNVNWTGLGTTPIQFQELEANANSLSMNYVRVNGAMTVTGSGGINVSTLNVRGQLTTPAAAGLGIDSLYLGATVPVAPGSGRVAANVYILDNGGTQSMPTLPTPGGGLDSATVIVRSNLSMTANLVLKGLQLDGSSRLDLAGHTLAVNGPLVSNGGTLAGTGQAVSTGRLQVNGLTVDNVQLILNENGTALTHQFDNVTFQNLTTPSGALLAMTGPGNSVTPRSLTFTNVNFPLISSGLYTSLDASNDQALTLVMQGSNRLEAGPGASDPAGQTTVNGATILWQ